MGLRRFRADLHIHSCLSPCGDLDIYPRRIVQRALEEGLDIIAVSDHNTAENAAAAIRAAEGTGLTVLPGMEVTSEEEVHILGVFGAMEDVLPLQEEIFRRLPKAPPNDRFAGEQAIVDEEDAVTGFNPYRLMAAAHMDVQEVVDLIHRSGGLAIASHIDRGAFGILSQLGFIPSGLPLDALEVSPLGNVPEVRTDLGTVVRLPVVRFSDAHRPEEIGRASTDLLLEAPLFSEVRMAFQGMNGRRVLGP
jgi:3',5'-nucleoside bisphosphate phosphatase